MDQGFDIVGAGAIGCFVGGLLQAAGTDVRYIARPKTAARLRENGLRLRTFDNRAVALPGDALTIASPTDPQDKRVLLLCVKSMDTLAFTETLKAAGHEAATIISLQNGIDNVERLQGALLRAQVLGGMVSFNVVRDGSGGFAMATEGALYLEASPEAGFIRDALGSNGIKVELRDDMKTVQWSKLCLNLNNALNALSGRPLAEQLRDRDWRRLLALCIDETLAVARAKGVAMTRIGKIHPRIVPTVLRMPDFLFERLARQMLAIAPDARTSMAADLIAGRPTEVDYLNGAVVREGKKLGVPTPANALVTQVTHEVFDGAKAHSMGARDILQQL